VWKFISDVWERILFSAVGLSMIGYSLWLVYKDQVTNSSIVFGLGLLSFIYANISRFKKFKGFGVEAELWEDKQKEAEALIERLRDVVAIYTREVIRGKLRQGRLSHPTWGERWNLFDDLINEHKALGQKIDFDDLKKEMDTYFLFDLVRPNVEKIRMSISGAKSLAYKKVDKEFGSPIKDSQGYRVRLDQIQVIKDSIKNQLDISAQGNLAGEVLDMWSFAKERLKQDFDIDIEIDIEVLRQLNLISDLYQRRPVDVTPELIDLADSKE